jgi:hypothetical protein
MMGSAGSAIRLFLDEPFDISAYLSAGSGIVHLTQLDELFLDIFIDFYQQLVVLGFFAHFGPLYYSFVTLLYK